MSFGAEIPKLALMEKVIRYLQYYLEKQFQEAGNLEEGLGLLNLVCLV